MRIHRAVIWLGVMTFLVSPAKADGTIGQEIRVSVSAPISGRPTAVVEGELSQEGIVQALLKVSSSLLKPDLFTKTQDVLKRRIEDDGGSLVADYRVLRKSTADGILRMDLSVFPKRDQVEMKLESWGFSDVSVKKPGIGLYPLAERGAKSSSLERPAQWTSRLARRLRDLGYSVEELRGPTPENPAATTKEVVDFVVWGTYGLHREDTWTAQVSAAAPGGHSNPVSLQGNFKLEEGADLAAGLLASRLLERILPLWSRQIGTGDAYELEFRGLKSQRSYQDVRALLNSGQRGLVGAKEHEFTVGSVVFEATFEGSAGELGRMLEGRGITGGVLHVASSTGKRVVIDLK